MKNLSYMPETNKVKRFDAWNKLFFTLTIMSIVTAAIQNVMLVERINKKDALINQHKENVNALIQAYNEKDSLYYQRNFEYRELEQSYQRLLSDYKKMKDQQEKNTEDKILSQTQEQHRE